MSDRLCKLSPILSLPLGSSTLYDPRKTPRGERPAPPDPKTEIAPDDPARAAALRPDPPQQIYPIRRSGATPTGSEIGWRRPEPLRGGGKEGGRWGGGRGGRGGGEEVIAISKINDDMFWLPNVQPFSHNRLFSQARSRTDPRGGPHGTRSRCAWSSRSRRSAAGGDPRGPPARHADRPPAGSAGRHQPACGAAPGQRLGSEAPVRFHPQGHRATERSLLVRN